MATEIIHHNDVAATEHGHKKLLHPCQKAGPVDRLVEHAGRVNAVASQGSHERHGVTVAVRHSVHQTLALRAPAAEAGHVGLRPGFINKDKPSCINLILMTLPLRAPTCDVGTFLLAGVQSFF